MYPIEIPRYSPKTKVVDGQTLIFDFVRKKYLVITPEELVRQGLINHLINDLYYPKSLISVEKEVKYGKKSNRSDIHIRYNNGGCFMVVECKSFRENINQSTFDQAAKYSTVLKADFLVVTNGSVTYCCKIDHEARRFDFINSLPSYPKVN
ncbi:MAG: type I restriction enzyme HsdR N-terminal domain-containing protein [Bacteroidetes bacterium]|nr:type I restriction enzyme HsdR N-terminal domain-containing protein [Bacteroidota bacterium]MDA1119358.1 type I restriction enzyme HsdR N-terminal domain-containing protein [Bacteroidota bacterium]